MKNAFSRMGTKCASVLAGGVLMAGVMFAGGPNPITVSLAQPVSVGSVTLPAGQYVMTSYEMGADEFFVVRGEKTQPVTLLASRSEDASEKTEVTLSKDGDKWHFSKLTVAGEGIAYEFLGGK